MIPELVPIIEKLQSRVNTKRITLEFPSADAVRVVPSGDDTFPIIVGFEGGDYFVEAEEWHSHFSKHEQASAVVCWLLTPYYRIVRSLANGEKIATWLEIYRDDGWDESSPVYFIDPTKLESPLDGADEIFIRQQAVFLDSAFPTYYPSAPLDKAGYPVGTILGETKYENRNGEWHPVGVPDIPEGP